MGAEIIVFVFLGMGAAFWIINKNKAELPDPKEMKETRSRQTSDSDDLSSSLNNSLNQLSSTETKTKREAKKRDEFIRKNYKIIASFYKNYKFIDYTKNTHPLFYFAKYQNDRSNVLLLQLHPISLD